MRNLVAMTAFAFLAACTGTPNQTPLQYIDTHFAVFTDSAQIIEDKYKLSAGDQQRVAAAEATLKTQLDDCVASTDRTCQAQLQPALVAVVNALKVAPVTSGEIKLLEDLLPVSSAPPAQAVLQPAS